MSLLVMQVHLRAPACYCSEVLLVMKEVENWVSEVTGIICHGGHGTMYDPDGSKITPLDYF